MRRMRILAGAVLGIVSVAAGCSSGDGPSAANQVERGSNQLCSDKLTNSCELGAWPGGVIYYTFASGYPYQKEVRDAMDRWQDASANVIQFVEDASQTAKATIDDCTDRGESYGFYGCTNGCVTRLCPGNFNHEIGHLIGLPHEHHRYDRDHYVRINICDGNNDEKCGDEAGNADFGPFDYTSTMLYGPHHPDITRWDGSHICKSPDANDNCGDGEDGPMGYPKKGDGSAVVELYAQGGPWTKFLRTLADDGSGPDSASPFVDALAGGARIPSTSSPAIETWGGDSLAVYVLGSDGNIHKKWLDVSSNRWSDWESLGAPPNGASDPGVVSWGNGRSDLVARGGSEVFIMSTPTWGDWQSLGGPPPGAASAPTITSMGDNQLDVFVRGSDDAVYHKTCSADCSGNQGTWSDWTALGTATIRGKPAATTLSDSTEVAVAHGMDDRLWIAQFDGSGWGDWHLAGNAVLQWDPGCPDCSSPAVGSRAGNIDVYVRGLDDKLWIVSSDASAVDFSGGPAGGILTSSPATVSKFRSDGRADVIVTMPEEQDAGQFAYSTWWKKTR